MRFGVLLLIGFLVGSSFFYGGIMTAVMVVMLIFFLVDPFMKKKEILFPGIGYFAIILIIGILGSEGKDARDVAKDVWYVCNAALPIIIGYLVMQRLGNLRRVLQAFIIAAAIVAFVHILQFAVHPAYLSESFADIRTLVSPGYFIMVPGIAITLSDFKFKFGLLARRMDTWGMMLLYLLSVTLSFSRTIWVLLFTTVAVLTGMRNFKKGLLAAVVVVYLSVLMLWIIEPAKMGNFTDLYSSFFAKLGASVSELKVSEYATMADINTYWRGFESYRALQMYLSGSNVEYLFGQGFGTNVDLGFVMTLADVEFDRIPVLHNGYLYLLVKTGVAGVLAYLLFLLLTVRTGIQLMRSSDTEDHLCGVLLVILTLLVVETTIVISGLFSKSALYQIALLLGVLLKYAEVRLWRTPHKSHMFTLSLQRS